jgi:hypothetical protein
MRHPRAGNPRATRAVDDVGVRVAIVIESVLPRDDVLRVADQLGARGHEVLVLCARSAAERQARDGIEPVPVRPVPARAVRSVLAATAPDVVHAAGPGTRPRGQARSSARVRPPSPRAKFRSTLHTPSSPCS